MLLVLPICGIIFVRTDANTALPPGALALLPGVGVALILYMGQSNLIFAARLLSTSAFRYSGLISYSLYLRHWPVLAFYRLYAITPFSQMEIAPLMGVMTAAARAIILNRDIEFRPSVREYKDRQAFVTAVFNEYNEYKDRCNLTFIRPHEAMCDNENCAVFDEDIPIYFDDDHITQTYALKLSHLFDPIFQAMIAGKELPPRNAHN